MDFTGSDYDWMQQVILVTPQYIDQQTNVRLLHKNLMDFTGSDYDWVQQVILVTPQ